MYLKALTKSLLLLILIALSSTAGAQSLPGIRPLAGADSVKGKNKQTPADTTKPFDPVFFEKSTSAYELLTDSLFRWHYVQDVYELLNLRAGWITARPYSMGRSAGLWHHGMKTGRGQLVWNGTPVTDPYNGAAHLELLPLPFLQSVSAGNNGDFSFDHTSFALAKPWTDARFERGKNGYRVLSATISQNLRKNTNIAVYLGSTDEEGYFERLKTASFQSAATLRHSFSDRSQFRASFIFNNIRNRQPDGFVMETMVGFPFSRFSTTASDGEGGSAHRTLWFKVDWERRLRHNKDAFLRAGIYRNEVRRSYSGTLDASTYDVHETGLSVSASGQFSHTTINASGSVAGIGASLFLQDFFIGMVRLSGQTVTRLSENLTLKTDFLGSARGDGTQGGGLTAALRVQLSDALYIEPHVSAERVLPTLQERFHDSILFESDTEVTPFSVQKAGFTAGFKRERVRVFADAGISLVKKQPFFGVDSLFVNGPSYSSPYLTAGGEFAFSSWKINGSLTYMSRSGTSESGYDAYVTRTDQLLWLRNEFYYSGYLFNKATFTNAGVRTLFSPLAYRTASYVPVLDIWTMPLEPEAIPGFFRADIFIQARVRSMFLYYQIENVLNGIGQAGYFETARYPMPPRRFRFGIRWFMRN